MFICIYPLIHIMVPQQPNIIARLLLYVILVRYTYISICLLSKGQGRRV
jgi:hypothetical protein